MLTNLIYFTYFLVYGLLHSALATARARRAISQAVPALQRWYRLWYNLLSVLLLLVPASAMMASEPSTWNAPTWLRISGGMLLLAGAIFGWKAFEPYDTAVFLGAAPENNDPEPLVRTGLQSVVRHPLYTATLMLLAGICLILPDFRVLSSAAGLLLYLPAGIFWEEKKLVAIYGETYLEYARRVKKLIPGIW